MIHIKELQKSYGNKKVLSDLNLNIEPNEIYCLLGKNGAGKTTLIHAILDLIEVKVGEIEIFNTPHTQQLPQHKSRIGVVAEDLALIHEISGIDYLHFVGKIYKIPKETLQKRIRDLLAYFFEDQADLKKSISKYSTGMKKKIAFCAAVIHTPDLLILDEPFSGLDPLVANQMVAFLKKYATPERTIFLSSHDLTYVEKLATHIGVLSNSQLVFNSTFADFTRNGQTKLDSALMQLLKPNDSKLENISWL